MKKLEEMTLEELVAKVCDGDPAEQLWKLRRLKLFASDEAIRQALLKTAYGEFS